MHPIVICNDAQDLNINWLVFTLVPLLTGSQPLGRALPRYAGAT